MLRDIGSHMSSVVSVPVHLMLYSQTLPVPCPFHQYPTALVKPSCRHATWASFIPQLPTHTVPHWLL